MTELRNALSSSAVGGVPVRPQGDWPVIARLVTDEGERWVPMRAIRWTPVAVMVVWTVRDGAGRRVDETAWLPLGDVARQLVPPGPQTWASVRPAPASGADDG